MNRKRRWKEEKDRYMYIKYDKIIKAFIESGDQEAVNKLRELHYNDYKKLRIEDQVIYINELLAKGNSLVYIAEGLFGVDESTIRKTLNNYGFTRVWQFYRKEEEEERS